MSLGPGLTAERIGSAARFDPQLRVPARPRLRRGIVVDVQPDQVVVTGTPQLQVLRGRSASGLVPGLLDLLDGYRTHEDLAAQLGVSEDAVFKTLALLWACGIVEEHAPLRPPPADCDAIARTPDRLADLLSRLGDSTAANVSWEQAASRLGRAKVELFGDDALLTMIEREFDPPQPVTRAGAPAVAADTTLAVLALGHEPDEDARAFAGQCWAQGIPLLRYGLVGRTAELGPYVDPAATPCLECLSIEGHPDTRTPQRGDAELAAALLAREVFALTSKASPPCFRSGGVGSTWRAWRSPRSAQPPALGARCAR